MATSNSNFNLVREPFMILPYAPNVGVYTKDALEKLFNRLHDEGLWSIVFHENTNFPITEFVQFFSDPQKVLLQVLSIVKNGEFVDTVGLAWLTNIENCSSLLVRGAGSFCFFKNYQTPAFTDQLGKLILDYWFGPIGLDLVVGTTPSLNRAALLYIKRLGFEECGKIPNHTTYCGKITDSIITSMTKKQYGVIYG